MNMTGSPESDSVIVDALAGVIFAALVFSFGYFCAGDHNIPTDNETGVGIV